MKQLCYKKWVRVLAGILCILSLNVAIGSFFCFAVMESADMYERDKEDVLKEMFEGALRDYSIFAMTRYQDDFGMKELSETNFRYGIIQKDSIDGVDLNDKRIYEVCNFDREVTEEELFVYSCNMGENTSYYAGKTLFDQFYIYNNDAIYQQVYYPIEACYYVRNTKQMYYFAHGKLYHQPYSEYRDYDTDEYIDLSQEILQVEGAEITYEWKNPHRQIYINDMSYYLSDITIVMPRDLEVIGEIISLEDREGNYEEYHIENGEIVTYDYTYVTSKPYFVLSYVNEPLITVGNGGYFGQNIFTQLARWDDQDFFVQLTAVLDLTYSMRYGIYLAFFISTIFFLFTLVIVLKGAGHEKDYEGIKEGYFDKIPYDLYICVVFCVVFFLLAMTAIVFMELQLKLALVAGIFGILGSEWMCLAFMESTAVRVKKGRWWSNTLVGIFWRWCKKIVKKCLNWCKKLCGKLLVAIPFMWKAWIIMLAIAFLEFMGLLFTGYQPGVQIALWFVEKVILYGVLSLCIIQLYKLQQGAEKIAEGDMNSKVDTTKLFFDFKVHGENLNRMQEGIGKAVAERMKSEHFKTELITNVSHDIKTPLTSIINYVDLLEKEEIDNPKVQEYLEVLSRQSSRLKKLIEDLMEASKASTGNLAVAMECCDAGVMLTQTIGEFEEKLKAAQVELLVQNTKESVYIQADPRHLWRIFDNLMNNICKYAQEHTRAYVNIEKDGMSCRIIFRNISKYALNMDSDELMERFVRGDSSRNTEGSGLGLSIARSLTELMQGQFELVIDGDLFKVIVTFPVMEM